jgi:sphinganine-1-phosphate aldolase
VVAFASKTINIYALGDAMSKKGWHLNGLMNPPALHMAFTVSSVSLRGRMNAELGI